MLIICLSKVYQTFMTSKIRVNTQYIRVKILNTAADVKQNIGIEDCHTSKEPSTYSFL